MNVLKLISDEVAISGPYNFNQRKWLCEGRDTQHKSPKLDDFRVLIGSPRKAQTKISAAVATLEDLFTQVDEVLKNQMDKLMLQFKETQSEFFKVYQKSRVIVDR